MLFFLLANLTDDGLQACVENPDSFAEACDSVNVPGATLLARYATLGQYDFIVMVEADSAQTMSRLSVVLGARRARPRRVHAGDYRSPDVGHRRGADRSRGRGGGRTCRGCRLVRSKPCHIRAVPGLFCAQTRRVRRLSKPVEFALSLRAGSHLPAVDPVPFRPSSGLRTWLF